MKKIPQPLYYLAAGLLLAGYIYFFERGPVKTDADKTKDAKAKVFANYVADDIKEIKLENLSTTVTAFKEPIVLKKDDKDNWQITEPHAFRADESTIRTMLSGAADFNPDTTIDNPANLADFGLNTPAARASFTDKNGKAYVLLVGDKNATGASVYVKTPFEKTIFLVPSFSVDNLRKAVNDYRDKSFFKTDSVLARKIRVVHGGKTTVIEKDKDNVWNIVEPIQTKADDERVKDFLNSIGNLRIAGYENDHPSNLAVYGLSKPSASVEVWSSDGKEDNVILLGRKKLKQAQFFAKSGNLPYVFTINDFFDKTLDINLTNFRDKGMMKFDPTQAKSITVLHNGKTYVYQKDDKGTWSSAGRPKGSEEGVYLMNTLSSTMVTDFASKKDATGLKNPSYSMEVDLASGAKRLYRFGNIKANSVYLASDQNKDVYLVPSNMFAQLDTYYSAILTPVPVGSPVPAAVSAPAAK